MSAEDKSETLSIVSSNRSTINISSDSTERVETPPIATSPTVTTTIVTTGIENKGFVQDEKKNVDFETVNLELVDLNKPASPLSEPRVYAPPPLQTPPTQKFSDFYVSVNEHKKGIRGEKLYVTKDSRRGGGCKRYCCALLVLLVIAATVTIASLVGTGVIDTQPAFKGEIHKSGRSRDLPPINGSNLSPVSVIDQNVNNNDIQDKEILARDAVPHVLEGEMSIVNAAWDDRLRNASDPFFKDFAAKVKSALMPVFMSPVKEEKADFFLNVNEFEHKNGVTPHYRLGWELKDNSFSDGIDVITKEEMIETLKKHIDSNDGRLTSVFNVPTESIRVKRVADDQCSVMECQSFCSYDYPSNQFRCGCDQAFKLAEDGKSCIEDSTDPTSNVHLLHNLDSSTEPFDDLDAVIIEEDETTTPSGQFEDVQHSESQSQSASSNGEGAKFNNKVPRLLNTSDAHLQNSNEAQEHKHVGEDEWKRGGFPVLDHFEESHGEATAEGDSKEQSEDYPGQRQGDNQEWHAVESSDLEHESEDSKGHATENIHDGNTEHNAFVPTPDENASPEADPIYDQTEASDSTIVQGEGITISQESQPEGDDYNLDHADEEDNKVFGTPVEGHHSGASNDDITNEGESSSTNPVKHDEFIGQDHHTEAFNEESIGGEVNKGAVESTTGVINGFQSTQEDGSHVEWQTEGELINEHNRTSFDDKSNEDSGKNNQQIIGSPHSTFDDSENEWQTEDEHKIIPNKETIDPVKVNNDSDGGTQWQDQMSENNKPTEADVSDASLKGAVSDENKTLEPSQTSDPTINDSNSIKSTNEFDVQEGHLQDGSHQTAVLGSESEDYNKDTESQKQNEKESKIIEPNTGFTPNSEDTLEDTFTLDHESESPTLLNAEAKEDIQSQIEENKSLNAEENIDKDGTVEDEYKEIITTKIDNDGDQIIPVTDKNHEGEKEIVITNGSEESRPREIMAEDKIHGEDITHSHSTEEIPPREIVTGSILSDDNENNDSSKVNPSTQSFIEGDRSENAVLVGESDVPIQNTKEKGQGIIVEEKKDEESSGFNAQNYDEFKDNVKHFDNDQDFKNEKNPETDDTDEETKEFIIGQENEGNVPIISEGPNVSFEDRTEETPFNEHSNSLNQDQTPETNDHNQIFKNEPSIERDLVTAGEPSFSDEDESKQNPTVNPVLENKDIEKEIFDITENKPTLEDQGSLNNVENESTESPTWSSTDIKPNTPIVSQSSENKEVDNIGGFQISKEFNPNNKKFEQGSDLIEESPDFQEVNRDNESATSLQDPSNISEFGSVQSNNGELDSSEGFKKPQEEPNSDVFVPSEITEEDSSNANGVNFEGLEDSLEENFGQPSEANNVEDSDFPKSTFSNKLEVSEDKTSSTEATIHKNSDDTIIDIEEDLIEEQNEPTQNAKPSEVDQSTERIREDIFTDILHKFADGIANINFVSEGNIPNNNQGSKQSIIKPDNKNETPTADEISESRQSSSNDQSNPRSLDASDILNKVGNIIIESDNDKKETKSRIVGSLGISEDNKAPSEGNPELIKNNPGTGTSEEEQNIFSNGSVDPEVIQNIILQNALSNNQSIPFHQDSQPYQFGLHYPNGTEAVFNFNGTNLDASQIPSFSPQNGTIRNPNGQFVIQQNNKSFNVVPEFEQLIKGNDSQGQVIFGGFHLPNGTKIDLTSNLSSQLLPGGNFQWGHNNSNEMGESHFNQGINGGWPNGFSVSNQSELQQLLFSQLANQNPGNGSSLNPFPLNENQIKELVLSQLANQNSGNGSSFNPFPLNETQIKDLVLSQLTNQSPGNGSSFNPFPLNETQIKNLIFSQLFQNNGSNASGQSLLSNLGQIQRLIFNGLLQDGNGNSTVTTNPFPLNGTEIKNILFNQLLSQNGNDSSPELTFPDKNEVSKLILNQILSNNNKSSAFPVENFSLNDTEIQNLVLNQILSKNDQNAELLPQNLLKNHISHQNNVTHENIINRNEELDLLKEIVLNQSETTTEKDMGNIMEVHSRHSGQDSKDFQILSGAEFSSQILGHGRKSSRKINGLFDEDCKDTENEFKCIGFGGCLPRHRRCNGIFDCRDGSDELLCDDEGSKKYECNEFQCPNGPCIPKSRVCDGQSDCLDSFDEMDCHSSEANCSENQFYCVKDARCIPLSFRCDGTSDCVRDNEDEANCECDPDKEFKCVMGGGCIDKENVCDGFEDCADMSDEFNCLETTSDGEIRLRDMNDSWSTLCFNNDSSVATAACQQLGYSKAIVDDSEFVDSSSSEYKILDPNLSTDHGHKIDARILDNVTLCDNNPKITCEKFECSKRKLSDNEMKELENQGTINVTSLTLDNKLWPTLAYLFNVKRKTSCVVTILKPKWLITSHSCMAERSMDPLEWVAFAGPTRNGPTDESKTQIKVVKRIISHPSVKFKQGYFTDDLALIELSDALEFNERVQPSCLGKSSKDKEFCFVAGWTNVNKEGVSFRQYLDWVTLPMMPLEECNSSSHYNQILNEHSLCTSSKHLDVPCRDDSGAPLLCYQGDGWRLQGVLSKEGECLTSSHPDIFTSIEGAESWIQSIIGNE